MGHVGDRVERDLAADPLDVQTGERVEAAALLAGEAQQHGDLAVPVA